MGKIKNWSKDFDEADVISWSHDYSEKVMEVGKMSSRGGVWMVDAPSGHKDADKEFSTKKEAREYAVNWMKNHSLGAKEVTIKKSQLFEVFHQSMLSNATGRSDSFRLEVWDHRDEVREKYMGNGAYYPDGSPVSLGYKNLSDFPDSREFYYHLTEQDAIRNQVHQRNEIDSADELDDEDLRTEIEVTNISALNELWSMRNNMIGEEEMMNPHAFEGVDFNRIDVKWEDDIDAKDFVKDKIDFF